MACSSKDETKPVVCRIGDNINVQNRTLSSQLGKTGFKCHWFRRTLMSSRSFVCSPLLACMRSGPSLPFSCHCPPYESSFSWSPVSICGPALLFNPTHCPTFQKEPVICQMVNLRQVAVLAKFCFDHVLDLRLKKKKEERAG